MTLSPTPNASGAEHLIIPGTIDGKRNPPDQSFCDDFTAALTVASSVATTIGFVLPWLFSKLGYDPALGSGPLATVVQDVLSPAIHFQIASALVF
jgi:cation transporter-like permease